MDGHIVRMFGFKRQYPKLLFPGKSQASSFELPQGLEIENCFIPYRPETWQIAVKQLRKFGPDLVIVSYFIPFFAPAYIYICRALRSTRITALVHNLVPHERWLGARLLARTLLDRCDDLICLSSATLKETQALMPNRIALKARLGFHPVYDHYLNSVANDTKREPHTLLFFGLIKRYKGLDLLLKAMPELIKAIPDVRLLIAGEVYGSDSQYTELIQSEGLTRHVEARFSFIPDNEVAAIFGRASLCVLPYRGASQSGVIALSYAFGIPVLASRLEGLAEYVDEGSTGLLVDARPEPDPHDLAKAMIHYFQNGLYDSMSPAVREKALQYTWSKLAELILA